MLQQIILLGATPKSSPYFIGVNRSFCNNTYFHQNNKLYCGANNYSRKNDNTYCLAHIVNTDNQEVKCSTETTTQGSDNSCYITLKTNRGTHHEVPRFQFIYPYERNLLKAGQRMFPMDEGNIR